jgi:ferredoxin
MLVWIDQDCCTGAGLCVDHCPDLFVVLDDGIGYVRDGGLVITDPDHPAIPVPHALRAGGDRRRRALPRRMHLPPTGRPPAKHR